MHTTTMKPRATLAGAVWRAVRRFINPPPPTRQQLKVMRHLARLDDHLLADIGLGRSEIIPAVLHGRRAVLSSGAHQL
jgi:uncharacterized protein YjiS (DUF1127 family)